MRYNDGWKKVNKGGKLINTKAAVEQLISGYKTLQAEIKDIDIQLNDLRDSAKGLDTTKEPTGKTYKIQSETEIFALNAVEKTPMLQSRKKYAEQLLKRIDNAIEYLNDDEKIIIQRAVIEHKRYWQIIEELHWSEASCKRIKRDALERLGQILYHKEG